MVGRRRVLWLWVLMLLCGAARAEWQFAVDVPGPQAGQRPLHATILHASMWIPPACRQVRGILLGEQIILEDKVMQDPTMRAMAAREDLAFVQVSRGSLGEFDYKGKREDLLLQRTLDALAAESGYAEVATAPLVALGHSGGAIMAWNIAYWKPSRVIAVVGLHAAAIPPPVWDPKANVNGVPILGISGEYESCAGGCWSIAPRRRRR
jgi:hypothetical protein